MGIPLNKPVKKLTVYAAKGAGLADVRLGLKDITETMKCDALDFEEGAGEVPVEGVEGLSLTLTVS
jgi:hypothetical protein